MYQNTLSKDITLQGVGLHSGEMITLCLKPAAVDAGITFIRTDKPEGQNEVPALWNKVVDTQLCSVIANEFGASVGTIEHLMAALRGLNIDNVIAEIDGGEVPIMDGSSQPFVDLILDAGIEEQDAPRKIIKVLKEVSAEKDGKTVSLSPSDAFTFDGEIDFDHPEIGKQTHSTQLLNGNFVHDIAQARTFGFLHEVEWMRKNGLARGGSLENAIVLDQDKVMNEDGLRFKDEFIRHKLLDAIGDLYLSGYQIQGAYKASKPGHEMNNEILNALFASDENWALVEETPTMSMQENQRISAAQI